MSNRSLIEINHDFAHNIRDEPERVVDLLHRYLTSGDPRRVADELQLHFGITIGPMRHHSDPEPFAPRGYGSLKADGATK